MTESALTVVGTLGWLMLLIHSAIRGCAAGRAPSALFSFLIEAIVVVEVWAILPGQFSKDPSDRLWIVPLFWAAAIFPCVLLIFRLVHRRPATIAPDQNGDIPALDLPIKSGKLQGIDKGGGRLWLEKEK